MFASSLAIKMHYSELRKSSDLLDFEFLQLEETQTIYVNICCLLGKLKACGVSVAASRVQFDAGFYIR